MSWQEVREQAGLVVRQQELAKPKLKAAWGMLKWGVPALLIFCIGQKLGGGAATILNAIAFFPGMIALIGYGPSIIQLRTASIKSNQHGSAANATLADTRSAKMVGTRRKETRPYIGLQTIVARTRTETLRTYTENAIRVGDDGYQSSMLTVGHSGCGKTLGLGAPNMLLGRDRSLLVVDPAGELAAMFARPLGATVLNPNGLLGLQSARFNPLFGIPAPTKGQNTEADDGFVGGCTVQGAGMIFRNYVAPDAHWLDSARELGIGLTMFECAKYDPPDRSYGHIREYIGSGAEGIKAIAKEAKKFNIKEMDAKLAKFTGEIGNEIYSIVSHLQTSTAPLDQAPYVRDLSGGRSFEWDDLKNEVKVIFLVIDPAELMADGAGKWWLRVIINDAVTRLMRTPRNKKLPPPLVILDEFTALGWLPAIKTASNLVRKHGVCFWFFAQSYAQLKEAYGREGWGEIESACGTKICYRARERETAEHFSELAGRYTDIVRSENIHNEISRDTYGHHAAGFPLYSPHDIMGLPKKTAIVLSSDLPGRPIEVRTPGIYERPEWVRGMKIDANPYAPR